MTDEDLKALFEASAAETRRTNEETRRLIHETNAETRRVLGEAIAETRQQIVETNGETRRVLGEAIGETRQQIVATNAETRRVLGEVIAENRQQIDDTRTELGAAIHESRLHFDITAEGLRHEIRLVAEKVTGVDETLTREAADIRGEMRQGVAVLQAMMKFSHGELDRRVVPLEESRHTVEEDVADLQVRVERLEKPTH